MSDPSGVLKPFIPTSTEVPKGPPAPTQTHRKEPKATRPPEPQSLLQLSNLLLRASIPQIPKIALRLLLTVAILTALNFAIMVIPTYSTTGFSRTLLFFFVFITASYNDVPQRALYWVILLTIGKKLFRRVRTEGPRKVIDDLMGFIPMIKEVNKTLGNRVMNGLVLGGGLGFIFANWLARNNRFDKQSVAIVIAIAIINSLSKLDESLLSMAVKLLIKDIGKTMGKGVMLANEWAAIGLVGFTGGLIGNMIFAVTKVDNGGYVLGTLMAIAGIALFFIRKGKSEVADH